MCLLFIDTYINIMVLWSLIPWIDFFIICKFYIYNFHGGKILPSIKYFKYTL